MMEPNTRAIKGTEVTAELAAWSAAADLERAADPGEFVVQACERAKQWLAEALEHGDIAQIVELKSQAEAIRIYSMQKQLGKDAELSAAEIVRRAERGIGVAIRRGQEAGEIAGRAAGPASRVAKQSGDTTLLLPSPTDFASPHELSSNGAGIYQMTDDVTDEMFEEGLEAAKAESNLSRANVVRHARTSKGRTTAEPDATEWIPDPTDRSVEAVARRRELIRECAARGYSSRQIAERIGTNESTIRQIARDHGVNITADSVMSRTRRHDSNRIVRETVHALDGLVMGIGLVDFDELDLDEVEDWTISLANSIRALNRLNKRMKEMVQ